MAKRVPPGEKPFNPVREALARSVLQPESLPATAEEWIAQGAKERPADPGNYLDEISRGASAFTEPGMKRLLIDIPEELYERLKQAGEAHGQNPSQFVRLLIEREVGER